MGVHSQSPMCTVSKKLQYRSTVEARSAGRSRSRSGSCKKEKDSAFSDSNLFCNGWPVVPLVVLLCALQPRSSYATTHISTIWGAYDMWMFQGSRAWFQWGFVRHSYVLLVCRKFWFSQLTDPEKQLLWDPKQYVMAPTLAANPQTTGIWTRNLRAPPSMVGRLIGADPAKFDVSKYVRVWQTNPHSPS
eukprot:COSAG01_NODE_10431_length_2167_cov_8.562863_2_plen_189_part_00